MSPALAVACPRCRAKKGHACRSVDEPGLHLLKSHPQRVKAAKAGRG